MATTIIVTAVISGLIFIFIMNLLPGEKKIECQIRHLYGVGDPQFLRTINTLLGPPVTEGNSVIRLRNGDEIFPSMLGAIAGAQVSICMETYIYWSGQIGRAFAEALAERSRAGVKVHVVLDWVGSLGMERELLEILRGAGVAVTRYHPLRWYTLSRMNNRTHRKLLIVDGRVGFTGGVGIADQWQGNAQDPAHWRDSHFRVEGPAVAQMQAAFMDNWIKTNAEALHGERYFPELERRGEKISQVFKSSANEGGESARLLFMLSIASAERSILISASYFVPDELCIASLVAARRRGVRIDIIVPGPVMDARNVQLVSRRLWGPLLEAGVRIYEYQPTMYHCKIMVVDGIWSAVGSTNFDNRSFRLNDEANLNVFDRELAAQLTEDFEADRRRSILVSLESWKQRPILERLQGALWSFAQRQL